MRPPPHVMLLLVALLALTANAARVQDVSRLADDAPDCEPQQVHISLGSDPTEMRVSWKTAGATCPSEVTYQPASRWWGGAARGSSPPRRAAGGGAAAVSSGGSSTVGYSFLLSQRDMCSEPASARAFTLYQHRAKLAGLSPGAAYEYRIAGGGGSSATALAAAADPPPRTFRAAPAPSPRRDVTFVAFGDLGDPVHASAKSPGSELTLRRLEAELAGSSGSSSGSSGNGGAAADGIDLVLHVGDLSYANGDPDVWDSFMRAIEPVASRVPWMVGVGNHEVGYHARVGSAGAASDPSGAPGPYQPAWGNYGEDSRGECGVPAARRFYMPSRPAAGAGAGAAVGAVADNAGPGAGGAGANGGGGGRPQDNAPFWYGFDHGAVHFTMISTEHALEPGSPQRLWLEAELAAVDRCATPWLVVGLHRPIYVVYPHKSNREVGEHLRAEIEPLLVRHRVDLTVAGHVHLYYRTCRVADGECQEEGGDERPQQQQQRRGGGGGDREREQDDDDDEPQEEQWGVTHFVIGSAGRKLSDAEEGQEDWCVATRREWGYGRFSVRGGGETLRAEFVSSESGAVLDSVELLQARRGVCARQQQRQQRRQRRQQK